MLFIELDIFDVGLEDRTSVQKKVPLKVNVFNVVNVVMISSSRLHRVLVH